MDVIFFKSVFQWKCKNDLKIRPDNSAKDMAKKKKKSFASANDTICKVEMSEYDTKWQQLFWLKRTRSYVLVLDLMHVLDYAIAIIVEIKKQQQQHN